MKTIEKLRDLGTYGIHTLTGEADNLNYRTLCDVDLDGYKLLCETLGLAYIQPVTKTTCHLCHKEWEECQCQYDPEMCSLEWTTLPNTKFRDTPPGWADNWNTGTPDKPHVASIMLAHEAWTWIGPIALLQAGCHTVVTALGRKHQPCMLVGLEENEQYIPAPFDWDKGEYIGPAKIHLPRWEEPYPWFEIQGMTAGRMYKTSNHPHSGTRNTHAMTGRSL